MTERKIETILGPCSVHSYEQFRETVETLNHGTVPDLISNRGNLHKPRSLAKSWQGLGQDGVGIIRQVKEETGCRVSMEITTTSQLEYMLEVSDDLWLGAKRQPNTTAEIADRLRGVNLGMFLVKNPWAYDPESWISDINLMQEVLPSSVRVVSLFRGFKERIMVPEALEWRNNPDMDAVRLVKKETGVDAWIDYSHLIGRTDLIIDHILTHRLPEEFSGAMLEVDARPQEAKTDQKQVLTPGQAKQIIRHWREDSTDFQVGII